MACQRPSFFPAGEIARGRYCLLSSSAMPAVAAFEVPRVRGRSRCARRCRRSCRAAPPRRPDRCSLWLHVRPCGGGQSAAAGGGTAASRDDRPAERATESGSVRAAGIVDAAASAGFTSGAALDADGVDERFALANQLLARREGLFVLVVSLPSESSTNAFFRCCPVAVRRTASCHGVVHRGACRRPRRGQGLG